MSSTTNNAYITKSMSGIISYDDGDGGSMSGGVITATTLATKNINSNSLEPFDTSTNYNIYATAVNDIYLGNSGIVCYTDAPISSTNTILASQFNAPNAYLTDVESSLINTSTLNASTINVSSINIGTTTFGTVNCSTINASTGNIANFNFSNNTMKLNASGNMSIGTSNVNKLYLGNASGALTAGVVCNKIICETTQFDLCSDLTALSPSTTVNIGLNASIVAIGSGNNYGIDISELRIRTGSIITTTSPLYPLTLGGINMSANTRVFLGAGQNVVEVGTNNAGCTTRVGSFMSNTTGLISSLDAVDIYGNPSATQTTNISPVLTTGTFNLTTGLTTGTLNLANNLTTGITNICNSNAFNGTINIGATPNASSLLPNTINIGSSTTANLIIGAPMNPSYNYFTNTGTARINTIGDIRSGTFSATNASGIPSGVWMPYSTFTIPDFGVYIVNGNINMSVTGGANTITSQGARILDASGVQIAQTLYMGSNAGNCPLNTYSYNLCGVMSYIAPARSITISAFCTMGTVNSVRIDNTNFKFTATRIA